MRCYRLRQRGLFVEMEKPVPVIFEEIRMECGYRADLVVERRVIVDTKTIEIIGEIQVAQILKNGIKRVLNGFENPELQENNM